MPRTMPSFYEFFAGGGMARAGLGKGWICLLANDFDAKKGLTWGPPFARLLWLMGPPFARLLWLRGPLSLAFCGSKAGATLCLA